MAAAAAAASAPSPVVVEAPPPPSPPSLLAGPRIPGQVPAQALPPVGVVDDGDATIPLFPSRPGHPVCDFYQKTGKLGGWVGSGKEEGYCKNAALLLHLLPG